MHFSEIVTAAMKKSGLKKSYVAKATGYSYQHIYDLITGNRRWNEESINRVSKVLGIQINFTVESVSSVSVNKQMRELGIRKKGNSKVRHHKEEESTRVNHERVNN